MSIISRMGKTFDCVNNSSYYSDLTLSNQPQVYNISIFNKENKYFEAKVASVHTMIVRFLYRITRVKG